MMNRTEGRAPTPSGRSQGQSLIGTLATWLASGFTRCTYMDHDSLISQVSDHPEYSYRGMMIDPAITYLPPSFFEHLFDGMVSGFALLCMAVVWCPMFGTVKAT